MAKKVDVVKYEPAGLEVAVKLSANMDFTAEWNGKHYRNKDGEALKKEVLSDLHASLQVTWLPVIMVVPAEGYWDSGRKLCVAGFSMERFWVGIMDEGKKLRKVTWRQWELDEEGHQSVASRLARAENLYWTEDAPFAPPCFKPAAHYGDTKEKHYLPYTEELWANLEMLQAQVETAQNRLKALLKSDQVVVLLSSINGMPLLTEGDTTHG